MKLWNIRRADDFKLPRYVWGGGGEAGVFLADKLFISARLGGALQILSFITIMFT